MLVFLEAVFWGGVQKKGSASLTFFSLELILICGRIDGRRVIKVAN